ncbi:unnamed protein product [Prorocentrum cordatum]|uniref:Uncharacterized protein n=1 Tax=Prorocentrum cordatum TaxID=2364126 RepID=A0ABN9VE64_9DINO|nr:unnamed protein product [Polarella glacialis]
MAAAARVCSRSPSGGAAAAAAVPLTPCFGLAADSEAAGAGPAAGASAAAADVAPTMPAVAVIGAANVTPEIAQVQAVVPLPRSPSEQPVTGHSEHSQMSWDREGVLYARPNMGCQGVEVRGGRVERERADATRCFASEWGAQESPI